MSVRGRYPLASVCRDVGICWIGVCDPTSQLVSSCGDHVLVPPRTFPLESQMSSQNGDWLSILSNLGELVGICLL